ACDATDPRRAAEGDFVEPILAGNDHGPLGAEQRQCRSKLFPKMRLADSEQLKLGRGGIAQWAQQIKDRRNAQLLPRRGDVAHGWVECRSKTKADSEFFQAAFDSRYRSFNVDTEFR